MVKKKAAKRKRKKPVRAKRVAVQLEETGHELEEFIVHEEEEIAKALAVATKEVDEFLSHNTELKKLKKEVREKPLAYTALALTLGIAIGAMLRGRD